jgi:hypothetical protein
MNKEQEEQYDIPELHLIREIVRKYMPEGHRLNSLDLSFGSLEEGQEPRFLVLVELLQETRAPVPYGWVDKLSKIIREKWPKDDFYVKLKIVLA